VIQFDKKQAENLIRKQAALCERDAGDRMWIEKVEHLSLLCEQGVSKTHLAFLGTVMLAKALDQSADLFSIKPRHASGRDLEKSFSARTLCHGVLVPLAAELGISLGVSGREPLNNQPYFRMTRLNDGTPVHAGGRKAFDYMVGLVRELQKIKDAKVAANALRAFISVRRRLQPSYTRLEGETAISPEKLADAIMAFVRQDSEGGKRAQAVVAGLLDVFAGTERVEAGRVNDPSRKYPGDICVRSLDKAEIWEKAFEVRDKPVNETDVRIFGKKCLDMGVREAAVLMANEGQQVLDTAALARWSEGFGLGLTLFQGWHALVDQVLFWSELPKPVAAGRAVSAIHERLVQVEASRRGVEQWIQLTRAPQLPGNAVANGDR
jgi:hypothetical protein